MFGRFSLFQFECYKSHHNNSTFVLFGACAKFYDDDKINSLAPGRFQRNFRKVIFQVILVIDGWSISCKVLLKWMPMDLTDGKSTLVQVMALCRQATSHYLRCWPRPLSPYGVMIRPPWVNVFLVTSLGPSDSIWQHRTGSILAQVMACCLMVLSHCLNQ